MLKTICWSSVRFRKLTIIDIITDHALWEVLTQDFSNAIILLYCIKVVYRLIFYQFIMTFIAQIV